MWTPVEVINLVNQPRVRPVLNDSAVVNHASNGSDDVGSSTNPKHPYFRMELRIPNEVLHYEVVNSSTLLFRLRRKSAVPEVAHEITAQADSVEVSGMDIARGGYCGIPGQINPHHFRKEMDVALGVCFSTAPGTVVQDDKYLSC